MSVQDSGQASPMPDIPCAVCGRNMLSKLTGMIYAGWTFGVPEHNAVIEAYYPELPKTPFTFMVCMVCTLRALGVKLGKDGHGEDTKQQSSGSSIFPSGK